VSVKPLFLFSLPRAGSTLVQRVLSKHPDIATATEPWLLLPLLYALKSDGVAAEYGHKGVKTGIEDFIKTLPNGIDDYLQSVADFAKDIYGKSSLNKAGYFLDKTPRNSLVSQDILRAFPDGKVIFLWRNPLAIAASIIETFGHGKWNLYRFEIDLYQGLESLLLSAKQYADESSHVLNVNYEDFVSEPEKKLTDIYTFLELSAKFEGEGKVKSGLQNLNGRYGDPTGTKKYNEISTGSLDKWVDVFSSPLRKRWALKYLNRIGEENLRLMGYDLKELVAVLEKTKCSKWTLMASDLMKMGYGKVYSRVNIPVLRHSLMGKRRWKYPLY
jgi:hypothetical protein